MADYQNIVYTSAAGIARITLNRPERLNSFNDAMHAELRDALARVKSDASIRVLLLTGAGRGFCAGQDLSEHEVPRDRPIDIGGVIERNYKPLVLTLRSLPMPVVCAVNGVAAGAGANVALACDIVVAARSASFIQAFCKVGLLPDAGGTYFLPRLVGIARARGLALLGDKLTGEQAAEWGLIWKCVDDDAFSPTVEALLQQLAAAPTRALAATKKGLDAASGNTLEAQLNVERDLQEMLGRSTDFQEGVAAFREKRAPRFRGR